jgi:hypothetical protein
VADRPYGEFYHFYSVSLEIFVYHLVPQFKYTFLYCVKTVTALQITDTAVYMLPCVYRKQFIVLYVR